ncbi:TetR/AcrR family transcriptional regulator [Amycolatopsis magusensis]|uniref:TetR/AcrR family transcriptional regulator n=1 Tax=Amycolatopsis magusensis TaxID=882444 RepID=UPI003C2C57BA
MESASTSSPATPRARRGRPPEKGLAERRRRQIVDSACVVFTERGYEAANISEVAKHAKVGQGTVYRYFESKRELLDHVLDHCVERLVTTVRAAATREEPRDAEEFTAQLRAIAQRLFMLIDEEPDLLKLVLVEAAAIDAELKARLLGLEATLSALMASYLETGVRAGWLRHNLDTAAVAHGLNALIVPGFLLALRGEATEEKRGRYIDTLVGFAVHGVSK